MINISEFAKSFFDSEPEPKENWVEVYQTMIVHTRGVYPKTLLETNRPNEDKQYLNYRLANYRPITKHGINQAIDSVYRILADSNYSVIYSSTLKDYETKKFDFLGESLTFKQLFFRHVLRLIFDDPNGLLVWLPKSSLPDTEPIDNPENQPIDTYPVYVNSKRIKHWTDEVFAFEAEDKWEVTVPAGNNRNKVEKHPYYFIISKEFIWRFIPEYSANDKKVIWVTQDYYNLSLTDGQPDKDKAFPSLVGHQLGGNISFTESHKQYYDSFFGSYAAFGDEAINAFSDNRVVRVRYNFPFVSVKGQLCIGCKGTGKVNSKVEAHKGKLVMCDTCQGSGKTVPFTPFGHYVKEPPTANDSEAFVSSPAVEFYSPDVAILQHSYEVWEKLLEQAKDSVNLLFIKESQSGVAKEVDRQQKYETLIKIANNFFELMKWSLDINEAYRVPFISQRKENIVRSPMSFQVQTESQLIDDLNDMIAKESPTSYIATTAKRLSQKIYSDDAQAQKITEVLTVWDVLFGKTAQQVSSLKSTGGASTKDALRKVHGYSILAKMAQTEDLDKMDIMEIIEKAEIELGKLMPSDILTEPEEDVNTQ